MFKTLFFGFYAIISLVAMHFFLFMAIDIEDGKANHASISPHFHTGTDNATFALVVLFMLISMAVFLYSLYNLSADEPKRKRRKGPLLYLDYEDEYDRMSL